MTLVLSPPPHTSMTVGRQERRAAPTRIFAGRDAPATAPDHELGNGALRASHLALAGAPLVRALCNSRATHRGVMGDAFCGMPTLPIACSLDCQWRVRCRQDSFPGDRQSEISLPSGRPKFPLTLSCCEFSRGLDGPR